MENHRPYALFTELWHMLIYQQEKGRKDDRNAIPEKKSEWKWTTFQVIALLLLFVHDYCDCLEKQYIWEPFNYHTIRGIVLLHQKLPCKSFWVGDKQSEWWGRIGGEVDIRAMECIEKDCFISASVFVWLMGKQRNGNIIVWVLWRWYNT